MKRLFRILSQSCTSQWWRRNRDRKSSRPTQNAGSWEVQLKPLRNDKTTWQRDKLYLCLFPFESSNSVDSYTPFYDRVHQYCFKSVWALCFLSSLEWFITIFVTVFVYQTLKFVVCYDTYASWTHPMCMSLTYMQLSCMFRWALSFHYFVASSLLPTETKRPSEDDN